MVVKTEERPRGNEEITVERSGNKIIIPENMDLSDAQRYLREKEQEEETYVAVAEDVNAFPLDGAVAFYNVLRRRYGWTNLKPTPGMFGSEHPPKMIGVSIGHNETQQVPWGRCEVPNISGHMDTSSNHNEVGLPIFRLTGQVKRKHEKIVAEIAADVRKEVAANSIYKGKAIRINFRDTDGDKITDFSSGFSPVFLDMEKHSKQVLVYSEETRKVVQTNLLNPVQNTQKCRNIGIPLKRGILLSGSYGTGKTLTGYQMATECVQNGWTFIYLEDVRDLDMALSFAKMYMPCVLFSEDVDRCVAGPRTAEMDKVLNTLDGITSKDTEIMVVLTTNHQNFINPAFIRPGRMDTIVQVGAPDESAVIKLVRSYGTQEKECVIEASDNEILESLLPIKGANAAFFREVVERAKLSAITHSDGSIVTIKKDDLNSAALTLKDHVRMLQPELAEQEEFQQVDPMKMMMDITTDYFVSAFVHKLANPKVLEKILFKATKGGGKKQM